jgi:hypothetical protein
MRPDHLPEVPGVVTADDLLATARSIAAQQEPSGAIPWFAPVDGVPGHVDAWNHVEAAMALTVAGLSAEALRAYEWVRSQQRPDGSCPPSGSSARSPRTEGNPTTRPISRWASGTSSS